MLKIQTIAEAGRQEEGYRLLATAEWPARFPESGAEGFNPKLAPSPDLYAQLCAHRIPFEQFAQRYAQELRAQDERLAKLAKQAQQFEVILITYPDFEGHSIGRILEEACLRAGSAGAGASEGASAPKTRTAPDPEQGKRSAKRGRPVGAARTRKIGGSGARTPRAKKRTDGEPEAGYEFLEHTADIMVRAWGPDYLAAVDQAARAMFSVLGSAKASESFEVEERAQARDELAVYLLSRILAECDAREMVASRIEVLDYTAQPPTIRARIWGSQARARDAIKAVTFHRLRLDEKPDRCELQIVFDV